LQLVSFKQLCNLGLAEARETLSSLNLSWLYIYCQQANNGAVGY